MISDTAHLSKASSAEFRNTVPWRPSGFGFQPPDTKRREHVKRGLYVSVASGASTFRRGPSILVRCSRGAKGGSKTCAPGVPSTRQTGEPFCLTPLEASGFQGFSEIPPNGKNERTERTSRADHRRKSRHRASHRRAFRRYGRKAGHLRAR